MVNIPLGTEVYRREFGKAPRIRLVNRFFERNPTNQVEGTSLLARPGTTFFRSLGFGPIRAQATQPGAFGGDLFVVSGDALFRYDGTTVTPIVGVVSLLGNPSIALVTGPGFEHLFIADGQLLQVYLGLSKASGTLTSTGVINNLDTIEIDGVHYCWDINLANQGDGSLGDPYRVLREPGSNTLAFVSMVLALNFTGISGVDYTTTLTAPHTTVEGVSSTSTTMSVRARAAGTGGNSISTTVTVGPNLGWGAATLEGGGTHSLAGVVTPDDVGMVSLATLASHVLSVVSQSQRFYWIRPGEITIDPLDFASAESEPDQIISAMAVGDQVWFFGQTSTEVWYATGNPDTPFLRVQGRAFSRGVIEGTPVRVQDEVILVGEDGIVYSVGAGLKPISTNTIEERVRVALKAERENG